MNSSGAPRLAPLTILARLTRRKVRQSSSGAPIPLCLHCRPVLGLRVVPDSSARLRLRPFRPVSDYIIGNTVISLRRRAAYHVAVTATHDRAAQSATRARNAASPDSKALGTDRTTRALVVAGGKSHGAAGTTGAGTTANENDDLAAARLRILSTIGNSSRLDTRHTTSSEPTRRVDTRP